MEIFLTVWAGVAVAFSLFGGWIASQKRRSIEEGMLIGGLFGPIGVIVESLLPTLTKEEQQQMTAAKKAAIYKPKPEQPKPQHQPTRSARRLLGEVAE